VIHGVEQLTPELKPVVLDLTQRGRIRACGGFDHWPEGSTVALTLLRLTPVLQVVVKGFDDPPNGVYISGAGRPAKALGDPHPVGLIVQGSHNAVSKFSFHRSALS
jgi:hypothetical protein